ncbi:MAG: hypothetical protein HY801_13825 [Candidatus Lindowbacteria bacterium]|nr:hypothetical protein [Candidatus Lindowbacteria bacterium]
MGLLLYALNISILLFFLTAKTFGLATLFLFAGLLAAAGERQLQERFESGDLRFLVAGILTALSAQVRLYFVVAAPIMVLWLWRYRGGSRRFPWLFCAGFAVGSLPSLFFLVLAPRQFIFDNLIYHSVRNPFGLIAELDQKLAVAKQLFFGAGRWRPTQFSMLFAGMASSLFLWKRVSGTAKAAAALSFALGIVSILPTPTFGQYFCVLVPFLIISFIGSVDALARALRDPLYQRAAWILFLLFSIAYAGWSVSRIESVFINAKAAPGSDSRTDPFDWRIGTVERVSELVKNSARPDDLVVSVWPGYLLTAERRLYPGMENQYGVESSTRIPREKAALYRILRADEIPKAVADPATGVVVIDNWSGPGIAPTRQSLATSYESAGQIGNTEVFLRVRSRE